MYLYNCINQRYDTKEDHVLDNPFLNRSKETGGCDRITAVCSVNKMKLAKLPVYGIDDEIEGLTVKEFFSAKIVSETVKRYAGCLHIELEGVDEKRLPRALSEKAMDETDKSGSELAVKIISRFGDRLGLMLLALRLGESENRAARPDWSDEHWAYWAQLKDIILVGGLASGVIGKILRERVTAVFEMKGEQPYNIVLCENSSEAAVMGCASCITESDGVFVVMDFGQTGIKRSCVVKQGGEITEVKTFEPLPSKYMDWVMPSEEERTRQAAELHKYLSMALENAYLEAKQQTHCEPSGEIMISIASYTSGGVLNSARGGYAKLCVLGPNYAEILSEDLSGRLRRHVTIKLIHDGTAVALNFKGRENTVCLSVGSYFGVGFPETKI